MMYNTKQFTYNGGTYTFVAEASTIQFHGGSEIEITSERTGKTRKFVYLKTERDAEGEAVAWVYVCGLFTVKILND